MAVEQRLGSPHIHCKIREMITHQPCHPVSPNRNQMAWRCRCLLQVQVEWSVGKVSTTKGRRIYVVSLPLCHCIPLTVSTSHFQHLDHLHQLSRQPWQNYHHCAKAQQHEILHYLSFTPLWQFSLWLTSGLPFIATVCLKIQASKMAKEGYGASMWSLYRGSVIWFSWLDHNAKCFSNSPWSNCKLEQCL